MFSYETLQALNDLELTVYNYIMKNNSKVMNMTIREVADATHVSTTTVMRLCKKLGCTGYSEFRIKFKLHLEQAKHHPIDSNLGEIINYFKNNHTAEFEEKLQYAANMIINAKRVIFVGIGSSGILGKYGARYFSNMGKNSQPVDDPFYPVPADTGKDVIVIALSVSGETEQTIRLINQFRTFGCKIISITNKETSTIAKMADYNLSYYMPNVLVRESYNITTQVPVIYILEAIGRRLS